MRHACVAPVNRTLSIGLLACGPPLPRYRLPPVIRLLLPLTALLASVALLLGGNGLLGTLLAMRSQAEPAAFVDATAVAGVSELVLRVRDALVGRPAIGARLSGEFESAALALGGDASPPPAGASRALFRELETIGTADATTILLDGSGSAEAVYGLFGRLRDTLWQMPHHWVVAVDEAERFAALKPPADAFFDSVLPVAPLSIDLTIALLKRRGLPEEIDPTSLIEIAMASEGNPRRALRAANAALVSGKRPGASLNARARVLDAAAQMGRPHGMLMAELLDLGQASPSDAELLQRLGLTRSRVTVQLRELLEADLVETGTDKSGTPGRPKTIYRPKLETGR